MKCRSHLGFLVTLLALVIGSGCQAEFVDLSESEFNQTLESHEVVIATFFTHWCYHSKKLLALYDEESEEIDERFVNNTNAAFVRVDCDAEVSVCNRFDVKRYPTIGVIKNGTEYSVFKGERNRENILRFIDENLDEESDSVTSTEESVTENGGIVDEVLNNTTKSNSS